MSSKDYRISPPPKDSGSEPLFRVVYAIDVNAADQRKTAEAAWQMMRAEEAFEPVMVILDSDGKQTKLDLSEYLEFNKVTTGFVVQKYCKDNTGKFRCIHQEFIAGDDVQFENLKGDSIEAPEHEYQPFNMTLVSKDEIIDRLSDALTRIDVGGEQSKQFVHEIKILDELLRDLGWIPQIKLQIQKLGALDMVNKIYDAIEKVLRSIDAGGKQSKRFAEEIKTLREVLGYPQDDGVFSEVQRRSYLTEKLRRMSVEAEGLKASLPTLPLEKWFDGTIEDATIDVFFNEYDLAKLLRFIADVGVSLAD